MKINKEKKLLYVHIPKCGGSAVNKAYDMEPHGENPHAKAITIKEQYPEIWNEYLKFSIVRNPWAAEVSNFFYRVSNNHENQQANPESHAAFVAGGFKKSLLNGLVAYDPNGINCVLGIDGHGYPFSMMRFLTDREGEVIVDNILKLENLEEDFKNLCERNDIEYRPLQKTNGTTHLHYSCYYNEEWMIDQVYEKNEDYIEYFGYKFEYSKF